MADPLGELARTHYCGDLSEALVGQTVTLMGWVATRRDLGGMVFLDLRDREGIAQVVARPEVSAAAHAKADQARSEYVVAVIGEVARRETANPRIRTGAVEVVAREIHILSEAKTPPFAIEDDVDTAEDIRLRYRYLDLRRPKLQKALRLRHKIAFEVRRYMDEQGFLEIETPFLTKSTPEGARDYLVPSRVHNGQFYALPQSPQIFKQILMIAGLDKYFQIVRCFRDEDLRADRQPEFTQVDVEMSFPRMESIFGLIEPLFVRLMKLIDVSIEAPFQRMSYAEALERYGSDKPDLRFGMPIADVTEGMRRLGLGAYSDLIAKGAVARAVSAPGLSGGRVKKLNEDVWLGHIVPDSHVEKRALFTLRNTEEAIANLVKKGANETAVRALIAEAGAAADETVLVGVDAPGPLSMAMGILRLELGRELKLIDEKSFRFLWVTDFPLMEMDPKEGRFVSLHHPFTAPTDEDAHLLDSDPGAVRAKAYDLVLNGSEVGGGSIRIHDSQMQARIFRLLAMTDEEARARFGFFLDALSYGTPPHGGIALGLDRMAMIFAGASSLRDVIAFPKTANATDLMSGSPSDVRDEQLRELGVAVARS